MIDNKLADRRDLDRTTKSLRWRIYRGNREAIAAEATDLDFLHSGGNLENNNAGKIFCRDDHSYSKF